MALCTDLIVYPPCRALETAHVPYLDTMRFQVIAAFTLLQLAFLLAVYGITWAGVRTPCTFCHNPCWAPLKVGSRVGCCCPSPCHHSKLQELLIQVAVPQYSKQAPRQDVYTTSLPLMLSSVLLHLQQ